MFTGIIQEVGSIRDRRDEGGVITFDIEAPYLSDDLRIGDSVSINGVCLTVIHIASPLLTVNVISETVSCTTLGELHEGAEVNLEPALRLQDRLSGHIVLGHVDGVGMIHNVIHVGENVELAIAVPKGLKRYIVPKGSVAVDGVSLTVASLKRDTVRIAVIPHTADMTTLAEKMVGDKVNLEVDIMGKYLEQLVDRREDDLLDIDPGLADKIKLPAWPPRGFESWN